MAIDYLWKPPYKYIQKTGVFPVRQLRQSENQTVYPDHPKNSHGYIRSFHG